MEQVDAADSVSRNAQLQVPERNGEIREDDGMCGDSREPNTRVAFHKSGDAVASQFVKSKSLRHFPDMLEPKMRSFQNSKRHSFHGNMRQSGQVDGINCQSRDNCGDRNSDRFQNQLAERKMKQKERRLRTSSGDLQPQNLCESPARRFSGGGSPVASETLSGVVLDGLSDNTAEVKPVRSLKTSSSPSRERLPFARSRPSPNSKPLEPGKTSPEHPPDKLQSSSILNATSDTSARKDCHSKIFESTLHRQKAQKKFKKCVLEREESIALESNTNYIRNRQGMENRRTDDDRSQHDELGPYLLKLAKSTIASGDNPRKALDFMIRAVKSFEKRANGKPSLDLVISMHILAAIHTILGEFEEAVMVLRHSILIPEVKAGGVQHALAAFAGHMQLGDTLALLGRGEDALTAYHTGLDVQKRALGDMNPRVGETCRYLAEAHMQAMQFSEAEVLCQHALEIHKQHSPAASVEEATDRRLMGLICNGKGEYDAALEHLVLASMALIANGLDVEVAAVDTSIGDTHVALQRFDEAVFAYQKALTVFKSTKGEDHSSVASVYVSLAELYLKTGRLRESKTYCESALRIYGRHGGAGHQLDDIAIGLTGIAAVYEALNEQDQALLLLQKALGILEAAPGQQSAAAAIEAQIGVIHYMRGNHSEACSSFQNAASKLQAGAERKSSLLGIVLNQMGLACLHLYKVEASVKAFEEARSILEESCGLHHPETLAVYSNLAAAYDALGRLDDAIALLQYVVEVRENFGTAVNELDDEKTRLAELLKEAPTRTRTHPPHGVRELLKQVGASKHNRHQHIMLSAGASQGFLQSTKAY